MLVLLVMTLALQPAGTPTADSIAPLIPAENHILASASPVGEQDDRWLAMDKFWHFSASFVTVGAAYHACANRLALTERTATASSLGGTALLGLTKELCDLRGPARHFSWKDLAADAAGIALGYFVFIHRY